MNIVDTLRVLSRMVHNFFFKPNRATVPAVSIDPLSQCPTDDRIESDGLAPCQSTDGDKGSLDDPYAGMDYEDWVVAQRHDQFS